jgi:uncharacterized phage protein (TIGR01671 family)
MREILFRGKMERGAWVYGGIAYQEGGEVAIVHTLDYYKSLYDLGIEADYVIPETVGQFTGSTDKNGKKIFEGDVVDFYFFDKGSKNTKTMLIEWRDEGFGMRELFRDYRLADDFSIIKEKIFTYRGDIRNGVYESNNTYFVEVIGNIHDNPELLEVR